MDFATVSTERRQGYNYAKSKEAGIFYWAPPQLPQWALPVSKTQQNQPMQTLDEPNPDAIHPDALLMDFTEYAKGEADKDELQARYKEVWEELSGYPEHQQRCHEVTGIRIKELKQAA